MDTHGIRSAFPASVQTLCFWISYLASPPRALTLGTCKVYLSAVVTRHTELGYAHPLASAPPMLSRIMAGIKRMSAQPSRQELWHDRNFADPKVPNWRNVFELRSTKLRYMDAFPDKVDHYVLIRLEDLRAHYKAFLGIVQLWFNVQPRNPVGGGGALGVFVDAQLDDDLVNDHAELHGHAHQHVSDAVVDYVWKHLDIELEDALGYRRSAVS